MELSQQNIAAFKELLTSGSKRIVIVAHTNPDGDAIGSSLAMRQVLVNMGHSVECVVPNKFPYFLNWMPDIDFIRIFKDDTLGVVNALVEQAEILIFCDFNSTSRLDILREVIDSNTTAKRVLIDHHLSPDTNFEIMFSHPDSSSTCFLVYSIIEAMLGVDAIDKKIAELLYVGIMTDTGNFQFSFLTPALYRAVATLSEREIDIPMIYNNVFNSYTEDRAKLFGYAINRKMKLIEKGTVAYMSLTEEEMRKHNFQQGDSEGFVNYALSIKKLRISAIFIAHRKFIRVSLRSRQNVDVDMFARRYFEGGGHKNAAGGKSMLSMEQTIAKFEKAIKEYAAEGLL